MAINHAYLTGILLYLTKFVSNSSAKSQGATKVPFLWYTTVILFCSSFCHIANPVINDLELL